MVLTATPNQTVGPFFRIGLAARYRDDVAGANAAGERVTVVGRVLDADGAGVPDAVIEIWQADDQGRFAQADSDFFGWGRVPTDAAGGFRFTTVKPGPVAGPEDTVQSPHLCIAIFMRGLLRHLVTRMYFPDEAELAADPVLRLVPEERRATLIARRSDADTLEWDVRLQGEQETVFFDV